MEQSKLHYSTVVLLVLNSLDNMAWLVSVVVCCVVNVCPCSPHRPRSAGSDTAEEEEEGGSLEDELGPNPNRPPPLYVTSEDSEESDEDPST